MRLTDIDLPDDTTIIVQENGSKILEKFTNTLFYETHMDQNGDNAKRT